MKRTIDYTALLTKPSKEEVAAYRTRATATSRPSASVGAGTVVLFIAAGSVFFAVIGSVAVLIFGLVLLPSGDAAGGSVIAAVVPLGIILGIAAILIVSARIASRSNGWELWARLDRFATANGMIFSPRDPNPQYPGAIFNIGDSRRALNHFRSASDRYLDIGNYSYSTGSGKSRSSHSWGFMALHLDRKLPNMVLDSKANNGLFGGTNLPAIFTKDQLLSLEGNFDEFFRLYCPKQYERDALYVFTPDLMALLIDNAAPFDVEIVDDWLFVYSAAPFESADPAVYQRLFRIVDTVGSKALAQTERYTDERVGEFAMNFVAPQGQRLTRGVSVGAIVLTIVIAVFWIAPNLLAFGELFRP